MALPPQFKAHRLVLTELNKAVANPAEPLHTLEVFLDYVCPFSAKLYNTLVGTVVPQLAKDPSGPASRLQILFRHQVQPWHPSSTLVHEAGLAVQRAAAAAGNPSCSGTLAPLSLPTRTRTWTSPSSTRPAT